MPDNPNAEPPRDLNAEFSLAPRLEPAGDKRCCRRSHAHATASRTGPNSRTGR